MHFSTVEQREKKIMKDYYKIMLGSKNMQKNAIKGILLVLIMDYIQILQTSYQKISGTSITSLYLYTLQIIRGKQR